MLSLSITSSSPRTINLVAAVPFGGSKAETSTDRRSKVAVVEIGDARAMRNGDGQTAGHVGIRESGKSVETLGEVMIR